MGSMAIAVARPEHSGGHPACNNKNLSPETRSADLLKRMTLDEKVMQTQCLWIQHSGILNSGWMINPGVV